MTKKTDTVVSLNRMDAALARHGVRLKRMQLLEVLAAALGHRNSQEMAAADAEGGLTPPPARFMGTASVPRIGPMIFLQDPDGTVFAVDRDRFDAQTGRAADWVLSPLGGALDVSDLRRGTPAGHTILNPDEGSELDHDQTPEAAYRPDRIMPIDPLEPAYMTNGCCEPASVTQTDLEALGLPFGSWEGEFHPLTVREMAYIAEDLVKSDDGLKEALIGYSVLYRSAKHVMPTVEIAHATDNDDGFVFPPRGEVLENAKAYADRIRGKVEDLGGAVLIDEDYDDRILIQILVPFTSVQEVGDFEAWKELLAWLMVDPDLPTVMSDEIQLMGPRHRVSISWQQEGKDGDYDPDAQYDQPLLRVDVDELRDGEWIEARDGTFCSQIPAYAPRETIRRFAEMTLEILEQEGCTRRTCERLSHIEPHHVAAWHDARRAATADDYVAHMTYGNPDRGTSIDLRRRSDGSVRCEVYVNLDCAALFDDGDMEDVRAWLLTLPSDIENEYGPNHPSFALAPTWEDFEVEGGEGVAWRLVPENESEADWFAEVPPCAPFAKRFVTIAQMDV